MLPQGSCELVSARGRLRLTIPAGLIPEPVRSRACCVHGGFSSEQLAWAPGVSCASDLGDPLPPSWAVALGLSTGVPSPRVSSWPCADL